ncbi:MAG TPA: erythromycin biosynthesis sensory transduction protein eryC1 [Bacteroidetes bacterium]|nr:erythromycin biosynthesis sensory transduction protein eryC1 [Saprospirales bacterium]HCA43472.1 erythromycin biosynthesis sensory transduction protein eryC1 [Bacteroidota bacterium]
MIIPFLDLKAQYISIKHEIDNAVLYVIENSVFIKSQQVKDFEKEFARLHNVKHCIGVGNGTDAITISLKALGIKQGDEVIVPANSFIATSEAVTSAGGKVVFVDNNPETYTIDIAKIEESITSKTKFIIPVHLYGQPAKMDAIIEIASKYGLKIIEDSAQAHLAEFNGSNGWQKVGNFGDMATFSFYPGKNLGAYGDAGAILTNDDELARIARMYADHGRISKYDHEFEGFNSRLDGIQAAVLNVKLKYIQDWTENRREIASIFLNEMKNEAIDLPKVPSNVKPVWHLFVLRSKKREYILKQLESKGIQTGIHYPIALPNLKAYYYLKGNGKFPIANQYQNQIFSIPIFPELSENQVNYIIDTINGLHP